MKPAGVELVEEAIRTLQAAEGRDVQKKSHAVSRESLVAFSVLCAFQSHWPSSSTPEISGLIERFQWIKALEPDRFIKQRRIAIGRLAGSAEKAISIR